MYRIGYAQDIHKLVENRDLILAGIKVPFEKGLLGHSDADVVMHAFAEAILGALAMGDLGKHFPDSDLKNKNLDSSIILVHVISLMEDHGYELNNADISIQLEKPKLAGYISVMRENLSKIAKANINDISLKAGTNEGMDAVGKGEACVATAIVMLRKKVK